MNSLGNQYINNLGNPNVANQTLSALTPLGEASIGHQFDSHLKRLFEIEQRLQVVADALYGPVPQATHTDVAGGRPVTSFASRVRDLGDAAESIWNVVNRLQAQL